MSKIKRWWPGGALRRKWAVWGCAVPLLFVLVPSLAYLLYCNQPLPAPPDPPAPPEPNGFAAGLDAVARLTPLPDSSPVSQRNFQDAKVLREKLASQKAGLDELRRSLRMEWGIPTVQDVSQDFPYLGRFRDAGRMFAAESRLALAEGRGGEAMERALDAVDLGGRLGQQGPLIHAIFGLSCAATGIDHAERCVASLSAEEARRARARLDEIRSRFPSAGAVLELERRVSLSTIRKIFRNELDVRKISGAPPRGGDRGAPPWVLYPKPWTYHSMNRAFRDYIRAAEQPPWRRPPVKMPREVMSRLMLRPITSITQSFDRIETSIQLLRLELALQEYRRTRKRYPAQLSDLDGIVPTEQWIDTYSGRPLIYRPKGNDYELYSVGPNQRDDGASTSKDLVAGSLQPNL